MPLHPSSVRSNHLTLFGAAATLLALASGCQAPTSQNLERLERGYVYYCDGAGGGSPLSNWGGGVRQGLLSAGYAGGGEMYPWQTGLGVGADQVGSAEYKRGKARALATRIVDYQRREPAAPITMIGLSAGTVIAVFALEELPSDVMVQTVVLLSSSLSSTHDLSSALRHVRGKIYIFTSDRDTVLLFALPLTGTADRAVGTNATMGVEGAQLPAGATAATRREYAARIVEVAWNPEFERYGDFGGHTDSVKPHFVQNFVAPLVMTRAATAPMPAAVAMVDNPDYARWASFEPGAWSLFEGEQVASGVHQMMRLKATLVSRNADMLVVQREFTTVRGAETSSLLSRRYHVPARIAPQNHPITHPASHQVDLPAQALRIGNRDHSCNGHRVSNDATFPEWGSNVRAEIYSNPEIPGGLAKIDLSCQMKGRPVQFVGRVIDYGAKP